MKYSHSSLVFTPLLLVSASVNSPALSQNLGAEVRIDSDAIRDFKVGDINGDGHLDLVVTPDGMFSSSSSGLVAFMGDGTGSFAPSVALAGTVGFSRHIALGDLDGDGDLDLATNNGGVSWWRNDGSGQFAQVATVHSPGDLFWQLDLVDVDSDGDLDIAMVATGSAGLLWSENRGPLGFASSQQLVPGSLDVANFEFTDVDLDGDLDVVISSILTDRLVWAENNPGVSFGPTRTLIQGPEFLHILAVTDVDGDGDDDVVCIPSDSDQMLVVEADGLGGFATSQEIEAPMERPWVLSFADLDGDGDQDLATASTYDSRLAWHENFGGVLGPQQALSSGAQQGARLDTGDTDGDGVEDLFYGGQDGVFVRLSSVPEPKNEFMRVGGPLRGGGDWLVHDLASGDVNGDGDEDLLVARQGFQALYWRENLGEFRFGPEQEVPGPLFFPRRIVSADLDGDGNNDLLSIEHPPANELAWFRNLGAGSFGARQVISASEKDGQDVAAVDFDQDGDFDVVSISSDPPRTALWRNLGGGNFTIGALVAGIDGVPTELEIADLDNDGLEDVLVAETGASGPSLIWHRNQGATSMGSGVRFGPSGAGTCSVAVADIDGDLDRDVLAIYSDDPAVWVVENLGGGSFDAPAQAAAGLERLVDIAVMDVDHDGATDVVLGRALDDRVLWLRGRGDGSFEDAAVLGTSGSGLRVLHAGDLDGDGDDDLSVGSFQDGMVRVYENRAQGRVGSSYCPAPALNSTGQSGSIRAIGSVDSSSSDLTLRSDQIPMNALGVFIVSRTSDYRTQPGSHLGGICLGGSIGRYVGPGQPQSSGTASSFELTLDLAAVPQPLGFAMAQPGDTWHFQGWYRYDVGGGMESNFTDAVRVLLR
ncbi:MAG: FG-GAP repeat domain-containing protein [Myxococcota bacterium]